MGRIPDSIASDFEGGWRHPPVIPATGRCPPPTCNYARSENLGSTRFTMVRYFKWHGNSVLSD